MKIDYLRYFLTLANSPSVNSAADSLYISTQQLNRIIAILEDEAGTTLFTKSNKGIQLTEDGIEFVKFAKNILNEYSAMKAHYMQKKNNLTTSLIESKVSLFLPPCFVLYAPDIVNNLKKIAPNIQLTVFEKNTKLNMHYFDENAICFWAMDINENDLILPEGKKLQYQIFGKAQNCFVYNRNLNSFDDVPNAMHGIATVNFLHSYSSTSMERYFLSSVHQILDFVSENNEVTSLPDFVLPKVKDEYPDLQFIRNPNISTPLSVVYLENHTLTEAEAVVVNFCKTYIQNLQFMAKQIL